ncbi:transcriptional regulator BolA [Vibrio sp. TRT 21S02]|uniref:transcriptional regulator BolA n=1 Tax=unclassified Vibrio TaxID=2614977 RepID=UPI003CF13E58
MIQEVIESKINTALKPSHLEVLNESYMHNVPSGSESHFKVIIVSDEFEEKRLIARHRMVNQILADELAHHIHALAIHTYTPDEWTKQHGFSPDSPMCLGGSKEE